MNLIIPVTLFVLASVVMLNWFLPYVTPKSIQFGVRIPREREDDPVISTTRRKYHLRLLAGSTLIFLIFYMLPAAEGRYDLTLFSLVFELFFTHLNYYISFRKLHMIKVKQQWFEGVVEGFGMVHLNERSIRHRITGIYFIFPSLILIGIVLFISITAYTQLPNSIPVGFSAGGTPTRHSPKDISDMFLIVLIQAVITSAFFIVGWILTRTSQEIDASRPYTTYEQQNRFKSFFRDLLYVFTTFLGMTFLFSRMRQLDYPSFDPSSYMIFIPIALGYVLLFSTPLLLGQMGARLSVTGGNNEDTGVSNLDDDRNWKLGLFYYNRQDPSILVGRRFGIGWTFNFGNPRSWAVVASIAVILSFIALFYLPDMRLFHL